MDNLTPEQEKLVNFLKKSEVSAVLPLVELLEETNSHLKAIAERETPDPIEPPEIQRVSLEGVEILNIPGPKGEPGLEGKPGRDGKDGKNGVNGRDGRDGKDGRDGIDGKDADEEVIVEKIEKDLPKLGEAIRDALELLPTGKKLAFSAVEDLENKLSEIVGQKVNVVGGARGLQLYVGDTKKGLQNSINFKAGSNMTLTYSTVNGLPTITFASSGGGASLTVSEIDGAPSVSNVTGIKFSNGSVTDNGDGTVSVTTGSGGGGDVSSNTTSSVDSEIALFSGTGGKTIKRATTTGILKGTSGVLSAAVADTDYLTPATAASTYQPLDADLTTIAGLTATTDNFIQSKGSAWASRTVAQVKTDLGLSGTNTGDQTITLTGDVTGTGTGSFAATIGANKVTNAKLAQVSTQTIKGRTTAGTGDPEDLTATQATAILNSFVGDSGSGGTKGLVPAPATGDSSKYLKGDGTWGTIAGGGDFSSNTATSVDGEVVVFSGTGGKTGKRATGTGVAHLTSGVLSASNVVTADITDANVTLAKMADVATSTVFYRKTAGTGVPEVQTLATLKTDLGLTGTNSGDQTSIVGISGTMAQFDTAVSDGNIVYQNQALGTPSSGTLTNATGLPLTGLVSDTTTALGVGSIELGHASDTTLSRSSAGVLAVEGITVSMNSTSATHTAGTIELGAALDTTLSRSAAGVLAVEGVVIPSISSTNTLTNKRITKRTGTTTSSATPTINTDNVDFYSITALAVAITSFTTNLSGTPTEGQTLWIAITDDGTPRTISWGTSFEASTVALPTTTVASTRLDVGFIWNTATSKWRCVASA